MNAMPDAQLCHIGLYAFDLETMVDFYSRIFGLVVTDRGHSARGEIAFLSRDRSSITRSPSPPAAQGRTIHHHQPDFVPRAGLRICGSTIRGW
jgi:catechol 2,3-dioxygenase-like lactoylglutathione lyase family enzyme